MTLIYDTHTAEKNTWAFSIDNSFRDYMSYDPKPFNLKVKYNPAVHTNEHYQYVLNTLNTIFEELIKSIGDSYYGASTFGDGTVYDGVNNEFGALCDVGTTHTITLPNNVDVLTHNMNSFTYIKESCGVLPTIIYFYYLLNLSHKITLEEVTGICTSAPNSYEGYNITSKWVSEAESRSKNLYLTGKMYQSIEYALSTFNLHRVPLESLPPLTRVINNRNLAFIKDIPSIRKEVTGDVDELLNHPLLYLLFSNSNRTKFRLEDYNLQDIRLLFQYFSTSDLETRVNLLKDYWVKGGTTFQSRSMFHLLDYVSD